jgi:tripartite-type tricarboxylate transporter receptor subunit TctC
MAKLLAVVAAAVLAGLSAAAAQSYPSRPITMIVPFPAGGPTDTIGRVLAERISATLGQPVIVENPVGASGSIGTGRVARAAPDGYTLGLGNWPTHTVNGATYKLNYDIVADFDPISMISSDPLLIVATKTIPSSNLRDFIDWVKANQETAVQATTGAGSSNHVAGTLFQRETGTKYQFIYYRSSSLAMPDLIAGRIHFMIDTAANSVPQVRTGTIKGFAVTAKTRLPALPDLPTVDEAGLPGFYCLNWHGLWVPKGTPRAIVEKLNDAVVQALAHPSVQQRLHDLGHEIFPREQQTPEGTAAFQKAEIERWWPVIRAANIRAE